MSLAVGVGVTLYYPYAFLDLRDLLRSANFWKCGRFLWYYKGLPNGVSIFPSTGCKFYFFESNYTTSWYKLKGKISEVLVVDCCNFPLLLIVIIVSNFFILWWITSHFFYFNMCVLFLFQLYSSTSICRMLFFSYWIGAVIAMMTFNFILPEDMPLSKDEDGLSDT